MDTVNYSEERFNEIEATMLGYLGEIGYRPENIYCVPCTGLKGDNLFKKSNELQWYEGMRTLYEALNQLGIFKPINH
jgi:elongation factor 1-alpha